MKDHSAKMGVLKELRKMAMDDMGEGMKSGLKKVTVASPSEKGLEEGLEKAQDMVEEMPMKESENDMDYDQMAQEKIDELISMAKSPEHIDRQIEMLQQAKEEKFGNSEMDDMSEDEEMEY